MVERGGLPIHGPGHPAARNAERLSSSSRVFLCRTQPHVVVQISRQNALRREIDTLKAMAEQKQK
jgi:hypothetical protein